MYGKNIFEEWEKKYEKDQLEKKIKEYSVNMSRSLTGKSHTIETKEKQSKKRKDYFKNISELEKEKRSKKISESFTEDRRDELRKRMIERNKKASGKNSPRSRKCVVDTLSSAHVKYL